MELKSRYRTACGGTLVPRHDATRYFAAHPEVVGLLDETIGRVRLPAKRAGLNALVDLGRPLGRHGCVEVTDIGLDGIGMFAQRPGRPGLSRVVQIDPNAVEMASTVVVVGTPMDHRSEYWLVTAYVGTEAPPEPWATTDPERRAISLAFWRSHALVWNETMDEPVPRTWRETIDAVTGDRGPHT